MLEAVDAHYRCGTGAPGVEWPDGVKQLLTAAGLASGWRGRLIFLGDSLSMQMWIAMMVLVSRELGTLQCPSVRNICECSTTIRALHTATR
eukprot:807085-Prymnesium_polylepis.2